MHTFRIAAITIGLAALAGCGTSAATPATHSAATHPAAAQPITVAPTTSAPDPVAILRAAGSAASGTGRAGTDISGDTMADGNIYGPGCTGSCSEQLTVYTNADQSVLNTNMAQLMQSPGSQAVITGDRFVLTVTGVAGSGVNLTYFTSPATIAQRVHGHLIIPGQ